MNKTETMKRLAALGSEQTRKTYTRHGVTGRQFGVRYGDLGKLVKEIGIDHVLAEQLWRTNNHDAMVLATMIAAPGKMTATALDAWVKKVENHVILEALASLAVKTDHALRCAEKWIDSMQELIAAAGWQVLSGGCCGRPGQTASGIADQPASFFEAHLKRIEQEIHEAPTV